VDNIKMDLREIGWGGVDCIDLVQNRDQWKALVSTVMNLRVPYRAGKFLHALYKPNFYFYSVELTLS
jgi:hypothetical protein